MGEIDILISKIRECDSDVWVAGPQNEAAIFELERAIGVSIPPTYRHFLAHYGGFGIANSFISGIIEGEPLGDGTGWLYSDTMRFREEYRMPENLLVVQPDEGAPYCLDTSCRRSDGECPVVCYELHSRHVGRMAETFGEWLQEWLKLRLADHAR